MGKSDCPPSKGSMSQNRCPSEPDRTASFIQRKQVQRGGVICPEPHSQRQNLSLEGSSPASCTAGTANSYQRSGAGRQRGSALCQQAVLPCFL